MRKWEVARAAIRPFKEKRDAEFDRFLASSDRPITLRDMMFALVAINQICWHSVERLKEIIERVPVKDQLFDSGVFDEMEHSNIRETLFNLYFSHRGVEFDEKFFKEFDEPYCKVAHAEKLARMEYYEAREREGIQPGEVPQKPETNERSDV
jgi:hypothetical protein